jgi:hypothetical protein
MKFNIKNNNQLSPDNEEFLDALTPFSEKCPKLQVFLHRERENFNTSDYEFLMVTPTTFGKVEVKDIYVEEPNIIIEFRDCAADLTGSVRINVYDPSPKALFISWQDVKLMVMEDIHNNINDPDLLEFDY